MKLKLDDVFEPHEVQKLLVEKARSILYKSEWDSDKAKETDLKVLTNILSGKEYPTAQQYVKDLLPQSPLNKKWLALEKVNKYIPLLSQTYRPDSLSQTFSKQGITWNFTFGGNSVWPGHNIKLMSQRDLDKIRLIIQEPFTFELHPKIEAKMTQDYQSGWHFNEQFHVTIPKSEKKKLVEFLENQNLP
jgi:hypothetical protein